ncbi:leukocyte elastase inhibitor-like isoform X1 [Leptopilina heterotoma]|uniref:leukocyte elastase inhibitor-like isoform X1 n=1 Tax=Leptopilina heterotoma TaxID=63436 RepID=UPI001CA84CF4|nr:leukocyte elastase inhibitor-like isoform X1 [Leptopilina heterotoma]XP_043479379.1 leukocyte elastase inhibitor-like isoform X1 [Leptopilina heterotoma]
MKQLLVLYCILICSNALNLDFIMPDETEQVRERVPGYYPNTRNLEFLNPVNNGRLYVDIKNVISHGVVQFALKIDDAMSKASRSLINKTDDNENIIFSPVCLAGNLALIMLAAKGNTFQEISRTLGLQLNTYELTPIYYDVIHKTFGQLLGKIDRMDENYQTKYANGLFIQEGQQIKGNFQNKSTEFYKSDIYGLNFLNSVKAKKTVNDWINYKTNGKITEILTKDLHPKSQIIFASALYFNAEWSHPFSDFATRRSYFKIEPNQFINIDLMFTSQEFPYFMSKELGVKIIGLPYKNSNTTMYVLQPKVEGAIALREFKKILNPSILDDLIRRMKSQECIVAFPKMKLTSSLRLKHTLQSLGMKTLFEEADLSSGFASLKNNNNQNEHSTLMVEDVLHSVEISINEKGTEASAATIASAIDRMNDKPKFIANRPFIFFIRHDITKLILFWATINKPTPNYKIDE